MREGKCVRSGYCCKQSACGWGTWDEKAHQCVHLEGQQPGEYACGLYDEIVALEADFPIKMFGAGCTSQLGNEDRDGVLVRLQASHLTKVAS